jgi:ubiquinone/menaquinone biosynthesis C-methylase UbiE
VDIHELAIKEVERKIVKEGLGNVKPVLAGGYDSGFPNCCADIVCALDMFFGIKDPTTFLGELKRIMKSEDILVIDDGHQSREETKRKILNSKHWEIQEESKDHLKCMPVSRV